MKLKYKNLKKAYDGKIVLDIKELIFDEGKIYGLKGKNGSGKSTLSKIIAKIEKNDGEISYPNLNVGYMPQSPLIFDMSVINNLKFVNNDDKKAIELLEKFDLIKYKNKNAKNLSGGEKQKVALARIMMKKYDLLILDEPTSSMDATSTKFAEKIIKEYNKKNKTTILMISHEEGQIESMTKNIFYMEEGKIKNSIIEEKV